MSSGESHLDATEWALRAREGDITASAAFVRATQAEVWRFCGALVSPADADDLTQDVYLRAFRALPEFAGRSSARTWLLAIARRTCADHIRALVRRRRLDALLLRTTEPVSSDISHGSTTDALLRDLTPERRSAFALTQLLGLSYDEAAQVENVPVGTIRSRVARARAELLTALDDAAAA
ncbi:MAG: sigma-70 family RNA polymerase sigma factor [Corynebacteriales bacterium]|nr:sigma-70 family RNA polymerase sigma factor [Mycobacteriales bacterium]